MRASAPIGVTQPTPVTTTRRSITIPKKPRTDSLKPAGSLRVYRYTQERQLPPCFVQPLYFIIEFSGVEIRDEDCIPRENSVVACLLFGLGRLYELHRTDRICRAICEKPVSGLRQSITIWPALIGDELSSNEAEAGVGCRYLSTVSYKIRELTGLAI